jgi:hypothetical protein
MKGKIIIIAMLIFMSAKNTFSQAFLDSFAINPKIGVAYPIGIGGGLELNTCYKGIVYSLDYYRITEFNIVFYDRPEQYYNQFGVMAGGRFGQKLFRIQFQGGMAAFWGLRRTSLLKKDEWFGGDTYNSEKFLVPGIVSKIGLKIVPATSFSIGIDLQASLNPDDSFFMPMLSIEFGNLRPEKKKR